MALLLDGVEQVRESQQSKRSSAGLGPPAKEPHRRFQILLTFAPTPTLVGIDAELDVRLGLKVRHTVLDGQMARGVEVGGGPKELTSPGCDHT
ncbi:MAG: hypothetical protein IT349_09150 [Candidatus Eisenbacteria bacterium]|nr:hypothetical protein [Candidatus Eisenbacteria bacterium]